MEALAARDKKTMALVLFRTYEILYMKMVNKAFQDHSSIFGNLQTDDLQRLVYSFLPPFPEEVKFEQIPLSR